MYKRQPEEGIELGYREPSVIVNVYHEGDVKSGMRVEFKAIGTVVNPVLLNVNTQKYLKLIDTTMVAGDVITINTDYGSKGATLTRDGEAIDYFRHIDADSTFMQLAIGDNVFRYDAESGVTALEATISVSYTHLDVYKRQGKYRYDFGACYKNCIQGRRCYPCIQR